MNNETIYKELCAWLKKVSDVSDITPTTYSDEKWMLGTGTLIGAYQETDLKIAEDLTKRSQYGLLDDDDTVEKLLQSPANALAMFSSMAFEKVGYNAKEISEKQNEERYGKYKELMAENPLLTLAADEGRKVTYQEGDYESLIENIDSLFDSITEFDATKIKESAKGLLKLLTSSKSAAVKSVKFAQDIITSEDKDNVYINMNTSGMEFEKKGPGTCETKTEYKTEIKVNYLMYKFNTVFFDRKIAEALLEITRKNIIDWINEVNS